MRKKVTSILKKLIILFLTTCAQKLVFYVKIIVFKTNKMLKL